MYCGDIHQDSLFIPSKSVINSKQKLALDIETLNVLVPTKIWQ